MNRSLALPKLAIGLILLAFGMAGCADKTPPASPQAAAAAPQAVVKKEAPAYKGTISGVSEKAKTIAIQVGPEGKAETMMLKYDDKTAGVENAKKGDSVTITYAVGDQPPLALSIKPNLAKLPEGVTEIKTAELQTMIDKAADLVLIDARPESRYAQSHLPGAVSISVEKLDKEKAAVLPKNKEQLLVFYCGGPT